jgi:hypothetical protein
MDPSAGGSATGAWHVRITCELHNIPGDEEDLAVLAVLVGDELEVVDGVAACIRWVAWTL